MATLLLISVTIASFWWCAEFNRQKPWGSVVFFGRITVFYERSGGQSPMLTYDDYQWWWGTFDLYLNRNHDPIDFGSIVWIPRFDSDRAPPPGTWYFARLILPLYLPILLTLIPSTLAWRAHFLANKRANRSLCPSCAYTLTGLPPAAPCPECGRPQTNPAIGL